MSGLEQFVALAERIRMLEKLPRGGNLPSAVPRILGSGKTRAEGLFDEKKPPALIERQYEYAKLDLNRLSTDANYPIPDGIREEQQRIKQEIEASQKQLDHQMDGWGRTAREVLWKLGDQTPGRDGRYSMGDLELAFDKRSFSWTWTYRGAYPLVSKLPHDVDYICEGYRDALRRMQEAIVPASDFLSLLKLAWAIAEHRAGTGPVLIRDVARMFIVADQKQAFWDKPSKNTFTDIAEAVFVINLVHAIEDVRKSFELEKAGVHQTALGGRARNIAFDLPRRVGAGTEPYSTIRLKKTD